LRARLTTDSTPLSSARVTRELPSSPCRSRLSPRLPATKSAPTSATGQRRQHLLLARTGQATSQIVHYRQRAPAVGWLDRIIVGHAAHQVFIFSQAEGAGGVQHPGANAGVTEVHARAARTDSTSEPVRVPVRAGLPGSLSGRSVSICSRGVGAALRCLPAPRRAGAMQWQGDMCRPAARTCETRARRIEQHQVKAVAAARLGDMNTVRYTAGHRQPWRQTRRQLHALLLVLDM
jgi:hypothetical protein